MRKYSQVVPSFWTGKTGKALLAKGANVHHMALYLVTCHHSNMIGLYFLPIGYVAHDLGVTPEAAAEMLDAVCSTGFAMYDHETSIVFVVEMLRYQTGDSLKAGDKRAKGILDALDIVPATYLKSEFTNKYQKTHIEPDEKTLLRGFDAPPKPGTGTGSSAENKTTTEQDQDDSDPHSIEEELSGWIGFLARDNDKQQMLALMADAPITREELDAAKETMADKADHPCWAYLLTVIAGNRERGKKKRRAGHSTDEDIIAKYERLEAETNERRKGYDQGRA
jgi:hypothetical protein